MAYEDNSNKIEIVHKELEFIQGCIERMARNSFMIKGWVIVIIIAFLGFVGSQKDIDNIISMFIFGPVFILWGLDGYFLYLERCYRKLYKERANIRVYPQTTVYRDYYDLNYTVIKDEKILKAVFSKTLMPFYLIVIAILIIIIYIGVIK
ncbi:MAG: hypothetical protein ROM03_08980 [Mucispirillum sp.]|nr:hypothetical protein [Mucispirillum sp.]